MSLAWHIAKKDVRRLALPIGVWLAVLPASAIAFRVVSPAAPGHAASAIDMWRNIALIWVRLLEGLEIFIACLLAGYLVLEDPLTDTNSFWTTRPIPSGRLLTAKLMAALTLFFVAPVVVLLPVWLACGFGVGDIVAAIWQFATSFGGWVLLALTTASFARSLPQFLLFTLIIVAAFIAPSLLRAPLWQDAPMAVRASRGWAVMAGMLPAMAVVLTHQYLTRRVARTWLLVGGSLLVAAIIRCAWPWELPVGRALAGVPRLDPPRAEDHAADIVAAPSFTQHQANSVPSLYGKTAWRTGAFVAPVAARSADGAMQMRGSETWAYRASLHVLGSEPATEPLLWQLTTFGLSRPGAKIEDDARFSGTLEVWSLRPRVLGQIPVRVGADLTVGANRTRILALQYNEGRLDRIFLEESDALAHAREMLGDSWSVRPTGNERYIDCYALVNAAKDIVSPASSHGTTATIELGSFAKRFRDLSTGWRESERGPPTLVKLRFERDHAFGIPLEVRGVSTRGWDQIP